MIRRRFAYILFMQLAIAGNLFAQTDFTASSVEGCTPFKTLISIDEATVDMDTISRIDWYFGSGDTITAIQPDTLTFEDEGLYTVTMVINRNVDNPVIKTDYLIVHRTISAAFQYEEYAPDNNYLFDPVDEITDPAGTYTYQWDYDKTDGSDTRSNTYTVGIADQNRAVDSVTLDTGVYVINLTVMDTYGCESSFSQRLFVAEEIQVANIFFPEDEEFFMIESRNLNIALKFQVFNRYGLLVFSETAPTITWNGKTNNNTYLTSGVYYYILETINNITGDRSSQQGFIHLYRNR